MNRLLHLLCAAWLLAGPSFGESSPRWGGELRFCLRADPKTFNPMLVSEEPADTIRYLTGGVLIRINRRSQALEPELAESWKIGYGGRQIRFQLRRGLKFSDGSPLTAEDVAFTFRTLFDPKLHAPDAEAFRTGSETVRVSIAGENAVAISFREPIASVERLFDPIAIVSKRSLERISQPAEMPVLGPFRVKEYKPGSYLLLSRNPYYWKTDSSGRRLPYVDSIRLYIQQNRALEMLRFTRGELHLINSLDPESFELLKSHPDIAAADLGPSLESEQIWFNQAPSAPITAYKKEWFRSREFRRAISAAINRADLCRLVYHSRAVPAVGIVSPSNHFWFNTKLRPHVFDPQQALASLQSSGFRLEQGALHDHQGHLVEFSVVTNAGNKMRERLAAMVEQDLAKIGVRLHVVTLDFPSLIERISRTLNYEACLLGMVNVDLDPSGQMNVWLSSGASHQWNPSQKAPDTAWEAEIDRLMLAQAAELSPRKRKAYFDRVQEIVWEEAPFLYLVTKNSLAAFSAALGNTSPAVLHPQTFWNVDQLFLAGTANKAPQIARALHD